MSEKKFSRQETFTLGEPRPVKSALLRQNVFVRDVLPTAVDCKDYHTPKYVSLDEVVESDGVRIRVTEQEYPITRESVNSYADGTNYRADVAAATSRGAAGRNLGDVAALQQAFAQSPEEFDKYLADMVSKLKAAKFQVEEKTQNKEKEGESNG